MAFPTLPTGSLILVTGANGLIGSHIADQFLARDYRVRGTVRSIQRSQWLQSVFEEKYGEGKFELSEVPDILAPGAYASAIKGVDGVVHVASSVDLTSTETDKQLKSAVVGVLEALSAAKSEASVKSFVQTSSEWAIYTADEKREFHVDENTWNEAAEEIAKDEKTPDVLKGLLTYTASKVKSEQAAWKWVKEEKPHFRFNTVLPASVFGGVVAPKHQGVASTAGFPIMLYKGENLDFLKSVRPQWFIDSKDAARLHVAATINPTVNNERIFGFAERYSWNKVLEIFRGLEPGYRGPELENLGWDQCHIPDRLYSRGAELLKEVGGTGWTSLHDSIAANLAVLKEL